MNSELSPNSEARAHTPIRHSLASKYVAALMPSNDRVLGSPSMRHKALGTQDGNREAGIEVRRELFGDTDGARDNKDDGGKEDSMEDTYDIMVEQTTNGNEQCNRNEVTGDRNGLESSEGEVENNLDEEDEILDMTEDKEDRGNEMDAMMSEKVSCRHIMDVIGISGRDKGRLGLRRLKKMKMNQLESQKRKLLLRVFRTIVKKAAISFLPVDPDSLIAEALRDQMPKNPVEDKLEEVLKVCGKGTREKRIMRGLIAGAVGGERAKRIIARDVICTDRLKKLRIAEESSEDELHEGEKPLILRLSMSERRMKSGTFRRTMERAENDFKFMKEHGYVSVIKHHKKMVPDESILECVRHIYQPSNRQFLAYGSKEVRLEDGSVQTIPKVRRTKSRKQVCREYLDMKKEQCEPRAVSRASFMRIIRVITSGQTTMKSSVDYCMGILLFENIRSVQHIVSKRVQDVETKTRLENQLKALTDYMKHGYETHLDMDDRHVHNTRVAVMGHELPTVPRCPIRDDDGEVWSENEPSILDCTACLKPFQIMEDVRQSVRGGEDGVGEVLDDACHKLRLFMGH